MSEQLEQMCVDTPKIGTVKLINNGARPFCGERLKNCYISLKGNGGFGIGSPRACFSE